ncbi:MAG: hypothetical protein LBQ31_03845 [Bacteroidales bacterium]|nr:hypothetical protein [Bacteroidales bacterium]
MLFIRHNRNFAGFIGIYETSMTNIAPEDNCWSSESNGSLLALPSREQLTSPYLQLLGDGSLLALPSREQQSCK